jgi:pSer/pThr/pTyr-binding forkhead associated (FHA) protein
MNLMIEHNGRLDYHTTEDASVLIGRSRVCDVVIGNLFVSRSHLRITSLYNGEYQVEDQQSANGSFVLSNDVPLAFECVNVKAPTAIRLGNENIIVTILREPNVMEC